MLLCRLHATPLAQWRIRRGSQFREPSPIKTQSHRVYCPPLLRCVHINHLVAFGKDLKPVTSCMLPELELQTPTNAYLSVLSTT